jgi:hypothetical protein
MNFEFSKNAQILNFMKIRPLGVELIHEDVRIHGRKDGQTHRHDEANSRFFCYFENGLKNSFLRK